MSKASKYVDEFLEGMEQSGGTLYNRTVRFVRSMDTDDEGALIRTSNNVNLISRVSAEYSEFLNSSTYNTRINNLVASLDVILQEVTQAYIDRHGSVPAPLIQEAQEVTDGFRYALEGTLTDESVEYGIVNPVINDLYYAMGNHNQADSTIEDYLNTIPNTFVSYFQTKVVLLVEQLERRINQLYGAYYQVERWRYVGPEDDRNRDFCSERVNGEFTAAEIQNWANEDWDGKIPATNAVNIFTNLGGYNCRHVLEPV